MKAAAIYCFDGSLSNSTNNAGFAKDEFAIADGYLKEVKLYCYRFFI